MAVSVAAAAALATGLVEAGGGADTPLWRGLLALL
jgi:hypothetical protein